MPYILFYMQMTLLKDGAVAPAYDVGRWAIGRGIVHSPASALVTSATNVMRRGTMHETAHTHETIVSLACRGQ